MNRLSLFEVVSYFGIAALLGAWVEDWIQYTFNVDWPDYTGAVSGFLFAMWLLVLFIWIKLAKKFNNFIKE